MSDSLFHLQLAFSKLEEEVKLYRNGTTAENLLELVGEKDREIAGLRATLGETSDKLRRIAKGSSDLITRCEALEREKQALEVRVAGLGAEMQHRDGDIDGLQARVAGLGAELQHRDGDIDRLQVRCAALLMEKNQASKLLEKEKAERAHQLQEFSAQLEKGIKFNTDIKERLRREQTSNIELAAQLADMTDARDRALQHAEGNKLAPRHERHVLGALENRL